MNIKVFKLMALMILVNIGYAGERKIHIVNNTTSLSEQLSDNMAHIALAMGVKEPLSLTLPTEQYLRISGINQTVCMIKLSDKQQILGVSCR